MSELLETLVSLKNEFQPITNFDLKEEDYVIFDLSENNPELNMLDLNDEKAFTKFIFQKIEENGASFGIGKYNEDRLIYKRSNLFSGEEPRSLHLGIDLWAKAGTPIFAPASGVVQSFANNNHHGDYGPTIILQHQMKGKIFHTLYGHLSINSLNGLYEGKHINAGEKIAELGTYEENVHWPPHLHFQIIENMEGNKGDYPGVCRPGEREKYLKNCPDPAVILGITI